jgi:LuxR family maltose regulon positive regulatory protein
VTLTSDSLVSTKLGPSQARPKLVARPRLTARLDREAGRELTLISAPAGFGKTTLLIEWLRARTGGEGSVAWVSLYEGDNDPTRFLSYVVAALGTVQEEIGEGVLSALRSPEPPRIEAITATLINDLAALPEELTLVLDDYHVIDSEPVHEVVAFLLEHLPPNVHLVISSRIDPPLPLARLRARNQIMELDAADLSFTPEEAATFLNSVMGLDLSAEEVVVLEERTEGWIAGLQLAALSMRDRKDIPAFLQAFSGSHRDVLDYLAEEVLDRQPAQVRNFLLQTSVADHLTGALCDALTGRSDGQAMLEKLERDNLFVVALDDERRWYRYHHLFAEFLRGRLGRENPGLVSELHLRASGWYEYNGLIAEAIGHAFSAPDHECAARLVEKRIEETWSRGEFPTVLRWLEALPSGTKRRHPRLFLHHAAVLTLTGRPDDAEPLLKDAERAAAAFREDRRFLLGFASAIRSWRARLRGDAPRAVELARRALSLLPDEDAPQRNFAAVCLGYALRTTGDLAAAIEALAEAVEIGRTASHTYGTLIAMVWQARVQAELGRLREADDAFRRALRFVTERGVELLPAAGLAHVGMGALLYERNDLDAAERELEEGTDLAERTGEVSNLVWGYVALSRAKRARGDEEGALKMALEAERVARNAGADLQIAFAANWMARLRLARGDLEAAAFEQERAAGAGEVLVAAWELERTTLARLLIARGERDEALRLLERLREAAETTGSAIEILALQALALRAIGEKVKAMSTLARSLSLAEPEGYVRTFVDEGPPMAKLLSEVLEARQSGRQGSPSPSAHYLRKLLAALERDATGTAPPGAELPEPLSERELEVLILIAAGKSNRQIAKELFVTAGTIKAHIRNIYRKLEVHSRTQALARARELSLL